MDQEKTEEKILLAAKTSKSLVAAIDILAKKTNRSRSKMIITILEEYLKAAKMN